MARKKFYGAESDNTKKENIKKIWRVGVYLRLSFTKDTDIESDSISAQRLLIHEYVDNQDDLTHFDTYIDDGYTGLNLDRPAFNQLMSDLDKGFIDCIIVKDLSRLGRNSIESRDILENVLPEHDCRFISIGDNLDTFKNPNCIFEIFTQFKQFMNEHYSSEISSSARLALDNKRNEGKAVTPNVPYGYIKNPNDKYKLIVDSESSQIIQEIFALSLSGMGVINIAKHLTHLGIDTPSIYKKKKSGMKSKRIITNEWSPSSVRKMLSNIVYIGHMEQKKYTKVNFKSKSYKQVQPKDRIIVYNTHEPIITESIFNKVQENYKRCVCTSKNQTITYLFSGMLKCADCGRPMLRHPKTAKGKLYVYYKCRTYSQFSQKACKHSHSIRDDILQDIVFKVIKGQIFAIAKLSNILHQINTNDQTKSKIAYLTKQKNRNEKQIDKLYDDKMQFYQDFKNNIISDKDYQIFSEKLSKDIQYLETSIVQLNNEINLYLDMEERNLDWLKDYLQHFDATKLTRTMMLSLVDNIYIKKNKEIRIVFRHEDKINKLAEYINESDGVLANVQ